MRRPDAPLPVLPGCLPSSRRSTNRRHNGECRGRRSLLIPNRRAAARPSRRPPRGLLRMTEGGTGSAIYRRSHRASAHLHQLLQAPEAGRYLLAPCADAAAPIGEADFADVDVAARIDGEPVRRDELAGLEPGMGVTEPGQEFALMGVDADPGPAIRDVDVARHIGADLADIEARRAGAGLHAKARRAVHVGPLRLVFAVAVEHLDPVVLAVGDVDPAVGVAADVVRDVELAGIGAGLAPRTQPFPVD